MWQRRGGVLPARCRATREQLTRIQGLLPESQGQNLAVTVLRVPFSPPPPPVQLSIYQEEVSPWNAWTEAVSNTGWFYVGGGSCYLSLNVSSLQHEINYKIPKTRFESNRFFHICAAAPQVHHTRGASHFFNCLDVYHRSPDSGERRYEDVRLPGKGNSNSHGARPVHQIISIIKWIWTSSSSLKNSLSLADQGGKPHVLRGSGQPGDLGPRHLQH